MYVKIVNLCSLRATVETVQNQTVTVLSDLVTGCYHALKKNQLSFSRGDALSFRIQQTIVLKCET